MNSAAVNDDGYSFPFSYINILYGSTKESAEREVFCGSQGEHGGQCYEAGSNNCTGVEETNVAVRCAQGG